MEDQTRRKFPWLESPLEDAQRRAREMVEKTPCIVFEENIKKENSKVSRKSKVSGKSMKPSPRYKSRYSDYTLLKYGEPPLKPGNEFDTRRRPVRYAVKNGPEQCPPHEWDKPVIAWDFEEDNQEQAICALLKLCDLDPVEPECSAQKDEIVPEEEPTGPPVHHPKCIDLLCAGGKKCMPPLTHHDKCLDLLCKGGKFCYDRHDPVQIAAANNFIEEMQFCHKTEEVLFASAHVPYNINKNRKEKKFGSLIHFTLQSRGALSIEALWKMIPFVAAEFGHSNRFAKENIDVLREFVKTRNYLFEMPGHGPLVRNRGYGYRHGIMKIAEFIRMHSFYQNGCKVLDLWHKLVVKELYPYDPREHGPGVRVTDGHFTLEQIMSASELVQLLETEHPNIFQFTDKEEIHKAYVKLTPEAFTYPSLWWPDTLPERPIRMEADRSRIHHLFVKIFVDIRMGEMAYVLHGPFHMKIVALSWAELNEANPKFYKDQLLNVIAYQNFTETYDFTVVKYCHVTTDENYRLLRMMHNFDDPVPKRSIAVDTPKPTFPKVPLLPEETIRKIHLYAKMEREKMDLIDDIIPEYRFPISIDFVKTEYEKDPKKFGLGSFDGVMRFIRARPHLWTISDDPEGVQQVFYRERLTMMYLLDIMSYFPFGLERRQLVYRLKVGQAGRSLQDSAFYGYYIGKLDKMAILLNEHLNTKDMDYDVIAIKGTFVEHSRIFLPFYCVHDIHRVEGAPPAEEEPVAESPEKTE